MVFVLRCERKIGGGNTKSYNSRIYIPVDVSIYMTPGSLSLIHILKIGAHVSIVLKADQRTGKLTEGVVARLLTKSPTHPHGIKVMLEDGQVGRVKEILAD